MELDKHKTVLQVLLDMSSVFVFDILNHSNVECPAKLSSLLTCYTIPAKPLHNSGTV